MGTAARAGRDRVPEGRSRPAADRACAEAAHLLPVVRLGVLVLLALHMRSSSTNLLEDRQTSTRVVSRHLRPAFRGPLARSLAEAPRFAGPVGGGPPTTNVAESAGTMNAIAASLLGFLRYGHASGYELAARIERSIGSFWNVTRSQIYPELRRLENAGYVEVAHTGSRLSACSTKSSCFAGSTTCRGRAPPTARERDRYP